MKSTETKKNTSIKMELNSTVNIERHLKNESL